MATVTIDLEEFDALRNQASRTKELERRIEEIKDMEAYINKITIRQVGIDEAITTAIRQTFKVVHKHVKEYKDIDPTQRGQEIDALETELKERFAGYSYR